MDAAKTLNNLKRIETSLQTAKQEHARLEGRLDELMRQLKADYGVDTLEEAVTALDEAQASIKAEEERIEGMLIRLRDTFGWEV
jgi:hypothetical protein